MGMAISWDVQARTQVLFLVHHCLARVVAEASSKIILPAIDRDFYRAPSLDAYF